jgi:hypothetical protein
MLQKYSTLKVQMEATVLNYALGSIMEGTTNIGILNMSKDTRALGDDNTSKRNAESIR